MALTIHAPHLPHLEDFARHRTMLIGIAAVSITAATVYVVQQANDTTPAATVSAPAAAAADTGEFLGFDSLPAAAAIATEGPGSNTLRAAPGFGTAPTAAAADTGEFLGFDSLPAAAAGATVGPGSNSLRATPVE